MAIGNEKRGELKEAGPRQIQPTLLASLVAATPVLVLKGLLRIPHNAAHESAEATTTSTLVLVALAAAAAFVLAAALLASATPSTAAAATAAATAAILLTLLAVATGATTVALTAPSAAFFATLLEALLAALTILFAALLLPAAATIVTAALPPALLDALLIAAAVRGPRVGALLVGKTRGALAAPTKLVLLVAAVVGALLAVGVLGALELGLGVAVALLVAAVLRASCSAAAEAAYTTSTTTTSTAAAAAHEVANLAQKIAAAARAGVVVATTTTTGKAARRTAEQGTGRCAHELAWQSTTAAAARRSEASNVLLHRERLATAVAGVVHTLLVIVAALDALARQLLAVLVALLVGHALPPLLDAAEHEGAAVAGAVVAHAALGRVVQHAVDDAVERAANVDAVVVPGLHELRHDPRDHLAGRAAGNLVEDVAKVVLGQHRVRGVGALVVVEHNQLLVLAALDNLRRARGELGLDLLDDGHDKRRNDGEDKDGQLVLELLHQLREHGDLLNGLGDLLEDLVVEPDGGHDLRENVLNVHRVLLRPARRDAHLLHLRGRGVGLNVVHLVLLVAAAEDAVRDHVEHAGEHAGVRVLAALQGALKLLNLVLGQLVGHLAGHGVQEIHAAKGARHDGVDAVVGAPEADAGAAADVREDVGLAHLDQRQFRVVAVRQEILEAVQAGAHEAQSLVQVLLALAVAVRAAEIDALAKELTDVVGAGHDASTLVGNVVLHARVGVDGELDALVHGAAEARVVAAGVEVVGIVLGVVDVVFGAVGAQALGGDLEFAGAIAKRQEAQDAEQQANGLGRDGLDGTDVNGLAVVAEPVAKVHAHDSELVELLAAHGTGHEQLQQRVLDVAMPP
ncbi:hypothetical protein SPBR_06515 [Sporothrix brasiliensis 5110]|uniref:Uncharacterized protein n=1 Tax=Sporothrix brasiliensis 5110 TaxID=1398154 RepID=A0A0C2ET37_9PEZI|nr:uncharacterized protein SPBR_06515 [Sporothrix brasiliensis 5110]KIH89564.1 hypothetical protein SPBR_06515 [Sporothrix brasiliensis 5110]